MGIKDCNEGQHLSNSRHLERLVAFTGSAFSAMESSEAGSGVAGFNKTGTSHLSTKCFDLFDLMLGVRTSRGLLEALGIGSTFKVVALARLESIPLLGGIVLVLSHFELIIVLARFVSIIVILADFGGTTFVVVGVPAVVDLGNIEENCISTLLLAGMCNEEVRKPDTMESKVRFYWVQKANESSINHNLL